MDSFVSAPISSCSRLCFRRETLSIGNSTLTSQAALILIDAGDDEISSIYLRVFNEGCWSARLQAPAVWTPVRPSRSYIRPAEQIPQTIRVQLRTPEGFLLNFFYWSFHFAWSSQVQSDILVIAQTSPGLARGKSRAILLPITPLASELKPSASQGQRGIIENFN